jgi:hypothetical protein
MNSHYKRARKLTRKLKKQRHPQKMLVNMAIDEVVAGMKKTTPRYIYRNGIRIDIHEMLA